MRFIYASLLIFFWLSQVQAQNNTWCVVMRTENWAQAYEVQGQMPADFIKTQWSRGNYISSATFSSGKWTVVASGLPYSHQLYQLSKNFPADWIEKQWAAGYDITELAYGNREWLVVMSKARVANQGIQAESWRKGSIAEVRAHIEEKWKQGRRITNIAYGAGEWVVTMGQTPSMGRQIYRFQQGFPKEWIDQNAAQNYRITSLGYGEGTWFAVMSLLPQHRGEEVYWYGSDFPKSFIEGNWEKRLRVVEIHYNFEQNPRQITQDHLDEGIKAANRNEHDLAIHHYTEALKLNPRDAVAYNNRAWSKYLLQQCTGALADVNESIRLAADEFNHHTRGMVFYCLGRHREAITDLDRSLKLSKKPEAYHYADLGLARMALGDFDQALKDYDRALQLDPNNRSYQQTRREIQTKRSASTPPVITWDYPDHNFHSVTKDQTQIKACVQSLSGVKSVEVLVNGQNQAFASRGFTVESDCDRNINQNIRLRQGRNTIQLVVTTDNGQTARSETRTIEFQPQSSGNYHALIIGVGNYDDSSIKNLAKPEQDVEQLRQVLTSKYTFNQPDVHVLKSPTKEQILERLIFLQDRLGPNDNLLIFFSGHGIVRNEVGYWLPKDAKQNSRTSWLSNGELRDYINGIKSNHTLIIADACFSGSILTGSYRDATEFACQQMAKRPSRRAMTSGANTIVPDESVFFRYFIQNLERNTASCFSAEDLYSNLKPAVIYNSPNNHIPQFGVLPQAGDEGGNFTFIRR